VRRAGLVVLVWLAGCGVRAPAPIDVDGLLRTRGPVEARRDLVIRTTADPRDVAGRLGLAALDERTGRPSDAIDELEAVIALGGPLGVRWHPDDQARLARLIAARGRARLARGAATAQGDLERARSLGAAIDDAELRRARVAAAIVALRHSDAELRERGRRILADQAARGPSESGAGGDVAWLGARRDAPAEQRGQFGAWLWRVGARRAAWDELRAWRAAAVPPRDRAVDAAYLAAARWWTPLDLPDAAAKVLGADPGGAMRCALVPCSPHEVAGDDAAERAYLLAPLAPPVREPADAAAVVAIALHQALRGEVGWGAAIAARIDLGAFSTPAQLAVLPAHVRPVIARLTGQSAAVTAAGGGTSAGGASAGGASAGGASAEQRLVTAAGRMLAGADAAEIAGTLDDSTYAGALRAMVEPRPAFAGDARAEAVARHASLVADGAASLDQLRAIAAGFARDPAIADRLAREAVGAASDAAAMHATLGALFDAIGDPARARAAWQAAVDASPEPRFVRGLAGAQARQGDGDAALITATTAAAASGDPAVVWVAIAQALVGSGRYVPALEAARSAIDLAGPETVAAALDAAIAASRALGRDAQAAGLAAQRARVAPVGGGLGDRDPTDARAALDAHRDHASSATLARLWLASRWNPRDIEIRAALLAATATAAGDPRRAAITCELVELAGDRDPEVGRAAAAALR